MLTAERPLSEPFVVTCKERMLGMCCKQLPQQCGHAFVLCVLLLRLATIHGSTMLRWCILL